ncbi:hypothetical protein FRB90_010400 [Tulasnella sp. 427]|nr:hypothetical protein FRB90_010400 [Tulasnella sp. 427]
MDVEFAIDPPLVFSGGPESLPLHTFIQRIHQKAVDLGETADASFMPRYVSCRFAGAASQWYQGLPYTTKADWGTLVRALLEHFGRSSSGTGSSPSLTPLSACIPTPAAAPPARPTTLEFVQYVPPLVKGYIKLAGIRHPPIDAYIACNPTARTDCYRISLTFDKTAASMFLIADSGRREVLRLLESPDHIIVIDLYGSKGDLRVIKEDKNSFKASYRYWNLAKGYIEASCKDPRVAKGMAC